MVDDLNPTKDGEASEKAHVATDKGNKGGESNLDVLLNYVVRWGANVEVDHLQRLKLFVLICTNDDE